MFFQLSVYGIYNFFRINFLTFGVNNSTDKGIKKTTLEVKFSYSILVIHNPSWMEFSNGYNENKQH